MSKLSQRVAIVSVVDSTTCVCVCVRACVRACVVTVVTRVVIEPPPSYLWHSAQKRTAKRPETNERTNELPPHKRPEIHPSLTPPQRDADTGKRPQKLQKVKKLQKLQKLQKLTKLKTWLALPKPPTGRYFVLAPRTLFWYCTLYCS